MALSLVTGQFLEDRRNASCIQFNVKLACEDRQKLYSGWPRVEFVHFEKRLRRCEESCTFWFTSDVSPHCLGHSGDADELSSCGMVYGYLPPFWENFKKCCIKLNINMGLLEKLVIPFPWRQTPCSLFIRSFFPSGHFFLQSFFTLCHFVNFS